jgi:hypothetical protein
LNQFHNTFPKFIILGFRNAAFLDCKLKTVG